MMRTCLSCLAAFTPSDLSKEVSKGIEAERKSQGVHGVLFRCYVCARCGHENLFVDLHSLEGESAEDFKRRRDALEATIRESAHPGVDIAMVEKDAHP